VGIVGIVGTRKQGENMDNSILNIIPVQHIQIEIESHYTPQGSETVSAIGVVQFQDNTFEYLIADSNKNICVTNGFNGEITNKYYRQPKL